jgi:hypothetical protein
MSDAKARWGKVKNAMKMLHEGKHKYGTPPGSPLPDQKKELDVANDDVKPELDAWMKFDQRETDFMTSQERRKLTSPDMRAPRLDYFGAPDRWEDSIEKPRLPVKRPRDTNNTFPVRQHEDSDRDPLDTSVDYDLANGVDSINPWMEYKERGFNSISQYSYSDIDIWERQKEEEEDNPWYTETTVLHSGHERHGRESSWNFDRGDDARDRLYRRSLGHHTYGDYGYDRPNDTLRYSHSHGTGPHILNRYGHAGGYSSAPPYGAATLTVDSLLTPRYFV